MGCGLLPQRTYASDGRAYADMVPPTGDEAILNFEWPPWVHVPTLVNYSLCAEWAETCSEDIAMQQVCLDGCKFWRGPSSYGEQGFFCELGVNIDGAYWGRPNDDRVGYQQFANRSCLLNVTGQAINDRDAVQVVMWDQPCRTGPAHAAFTGGRAPAGEPGTELWRVFNLGEPLEAGAHQLCYCADFEGCDDDIDFLKWVGTVAVVGKVRNVLPDSSELGGGIEVNIEITDLRAPIVDVTFEADGVGRPCSGLHFKAPGKEHTHISCWVSATPKQILENITVRAANGLHATSYAVFNRYARGIFYDISVDVGSNVGGDNISVNTSDLNANIERITFGGRDCLYLRHNPMRPHRSASCLVPPHEVSGPVHVNVYAPNGNMATGLNAYTYYHPGIILSVTPGAGPVQGDTEIYILTNDMGAMITSVTIGGRDAPLSVEETTSIGAVAFTPRSAKWGPADVLVRSANGNHALLLHGFTYIISCPDPGIPENGYRSGTTLTEGMVIRYACRYGYKMVGAAESTCVFERDNSGNIIPDGGVFLPPRPSCEVLQCPDPGSPRFGTRIGPNGTFVVGDVVAFYCPSGYTRFGPTEIFCQGNAIWSGATPTCESDYGTLTLVRYRSLFLSHFAAEEAFALADCCPNDGKLSYDEFVVQASHMGVEGTDVERVFVQMQWTPSLVSPGRFLRPGHYLVLSEIVNTTQQRVLMASEFASPAEMFSSADQDADQVVSREEFEGQATGRLELTKRNSMLLWGSVVLLGQRAMHQMHYLLLMGQADIPTLRSLIRDRFDFVLETWNASNSDGDQIVSRAEFAQWLLKDYGLDHLISAMLWRHVDNEERGYVRFPRYVTLGFGRLQHVSLVGFRTFLKSIYATRQEAVDAMDSNADGLVTDSELHRLVTRLGLTEANADTIIRDLCPIPPERAPVLLPRQVDALVSDDVGLAAVRTLIRSEHAAGTSLAFAADLDHNGQVTEAEWISFCAEYTIDRANGLRIFALLDPSGIGVVPNTQLRIFRGDYFALCDYRQLVESEFGSFFSALESADVDGNLKVMPDEFLGQARSFCLVEAEVSRLHMHLDIQREGFVDLAALSSSRMPFLLLRNGSLAGFRACLQSAFDGDEARIMQDMGSMNNGFPVTAWGLVQQGAIHAWEPSASMHALFDNADVFGATVLSEARYGQLFADDATPAGLRVMLREVAPHGIAELLSRTDWDGDGALSSQEFIAIFRLLGFRDGNGRAIYETLNYANLGELSPKQLRPVLQGSLEFRELRLLALGEHPPPNGRANAFVAADADRSNTIDFQEFVRISGTSLAVTNITNVAELFASLEIAGDGHLRSEQFDFLTMLDFDLPSMRHLVVVTIGTGHPSFAAVDSSGDGRIVQNEFVLWANQTLGMNYLSASRVFSDLDICELGTLHPGQLRLLHRRPDIVTLRAVLLSRYGRDWKAFAAADTNDDGLLTSREFAAFSVSLMLPHGDTLPVFRSLDFDRGGSLSTDEMRIAAGSDLRLVELRRLVRLTYPNASDSFAIADIDHDRLITLLELERFACNHLALRGGIALATLFQSSDDFGVGALPRQRFMVLAGDVDLKGYRKLVHSTWLTTSDAFMIFDLNFDKRFQLDEMLRQAAPIVIDADNARSLFALMTNRSANRTYVEWDIYYAAVEGLAGFRILLKRTYTEAYQAYLDVDLAEPEAQITLTEFQQWSRDQWELPDIVTTEVFRILDCRSSGFLTLSTLEYLIGGGVNHRMLQQIVDSAHGDAATAFAKADSDGDGRMSRREMSQITTTLGIESANGALLFSQLDIEDTGFLTAEQFVVMARPNHIFRLTNLQTEDMRFHIYELRLYTDADCTERIECDLPIASGHYVDLEVTGDTLEAAGMKYAPGVAYDGDLTTRWISECQSCPRLSAHVGCKFDGELQVRCVEAFQTLPPSAGFAADNVTVESQSGNIPRRRLDDLAKVAAGFQLQAWTGKTWKALVDIPKPPLWEIDNDGSPLKFQTLIPAVMISLPEEFTHLDKRAAEDFADQSGMKLDHLVILGTSLSVVGLVVFCVCCPFIVSPRCFRFLRRNAPERMDAKRAGQLNLQIAGLEKIEMLEACVSERAVVVDDWGIAHRVQTPEKKALHKKLMIELANQQKLEETANTSRLAQERRTNVKNSKKQAHLGRLKRMRDAYKAKTIAIDGIALRAPPAILEELGFDPDMIEAFALPGYDDINEADDDLENDEDEKLKDVSDKSHEDSSESDAGSRDEDADPLQIPPKLDEIVGNAAKEGSKHRKRRGAMPGVEEGMPIPKDVLQNAARVAASMHIADMQDDDEVEKWLADAQEKASRGAQESEELFFFNMIDVDEDRLERERRLIAQKFDRRRWAALLLGDEPDGQRVLHEEEAASESDQDFMLEAAVDDDLPAEMDVFGRQAEADALRALALQEARDAQQSEASSHAGGGRIGREFVADAQEAAAIADEDLPYGGRVYKGMAVRPRGLGTPRGRQLDGEIFRSALVAPELPGGKLPWGKMAVQQPYYADKTKKSSGAAGEEVDKSGKPSRSQRKDVKKKERGKARPLGPQGSS